MTRSVFFVKYFQIFGRFDFGIFRSFYDEFWAQIEIITKFRKFILGANPQKFELETKEICGKLGRKIGKLPLETEEKSSKIRRILCKTARKLGENWRKIDWNQ